LEARLPNSKQIEKIALKSEEVRPGKARSDLNKKLTSTKKTGLKKPLGNAG